MTSLVMHALLEGSTAVVQTVYDSGLDQYCHVVSLLAQWGLTAPA